MTQMMIFSLDDSDDDMKSVKSVTRPSSKANAPASCVSYFFSASLPLADV